MIQIRGEKWKVFGMKIGPNVSQRILTTIPSRDQKNLPVSILY